MRVSQPARLFPWGSNQPTTTQRLVVALLISTLAAAIHYFHTAAIGGISDFTALWFGSRVLSLGQNPYALIGPHKLIDLPAPLVYPAPALVAISPLTLLPFRLAGTVFVFVSAGLLGFGATRDGWQRLPIFASVAFVTSAELGQWSMLMTAAIFIPALCFFSTAKPHAFVPIVVSSTKRATWVWGAIGSIVLVTASFLLLPSWPLDWWRFVSTLDFYRAPIASFGGLAIGLVLIRWRRPEAWLIFVAACMPQSWYAYNGLILLAIAASFREASILSLTSSAGWVIAYLYFAGDWRSAETRAVMENVLVALCYLPATMLVLRRPNVGPGPLSISWLRSVVRRDEKRAGS